MKFSLRQCVDADREWACRLKNEVYREVVERQFGPWDDDIQRSMFESRWNPDISKVIMVENVQVGLIATEERGDCIWIDEIQIDTKWQNQGLGSLIISDIMSQCRSKFIQLQVLKENHKAMRLYERFEFTVIGESSTHYFMRFVRY